MKITLLIAIGLCSVFLLTGCSSLCGSGGGCGYVDYGSQCGLPSCTDNTYIEPVYSNPCHGAYGC